MFKFTDWSLERNVWSLSTDKDCLVHKVARDLIVRRIMSDERGIENLLKITRRYE